MSLLTNPFFNVGMGLLANSGPSLTPVNPWAGVQQGLLNARAAQYDEQAIAREQAQWQRQQEEWRRQEEQRRYIEEMAAGAPAELQNLARAFPEAYATSMAKQRFTSADQESVQIATAGDLGLAGFPPETPIQIKTKGGVPVGYEPLNPPAESQNPTEYRLWELAGRPGDFNNWLMQRSEASATRIDMGGADRATPGEVANLVYPDGSAVLPGELWETIRSRGARMLSKEEQAALGQQGTQGAKDAAAASKGEELFANYAAASQQYEQGISPYGENDAQAKIARDNLVTWYAKNVLGTPGAEPSPSLYEKANKIIPDYGGALDRYLFDARMAEVRRGIAGALGKKGDKGGDVTIEVVRDPKTGRLVQKQ